MQPISGNQEPPGTARHRQVPSSSHVLSSAIEPSGPGRCVKGVALSAIADPDVRGFRLTAIEETLPQRLSATTHQAARSRRLDRITTGLAAAADASSAPTFYRRLPDRRGR